MAGEKIKTEFHTVGLHEIPYIVAEIGLNHNGSLDLAKKSVQVAAECGADAAKFQLYSSDHFINSSAKLGDGSLRDFFRQFELAETEWIELANYTRSVGLDFFCSVFDEPSILLYKKLQPKIIKIASCDITNRSLMRKASEVFGKSIPFFVATGTADENEVESFVKWFLDNDLASAPSNLVLFQCVSIYPAPPETYNLRLIPAWVKKFSIPVGISDHTAGIGTSVGAVALGAISVEKHFTLDRTLAGPDHTISMPPNEFKTMVSEIRAVHSALGDGFKRFHQGELPARTFGRRAAYTLRDVKRLETLTDTDLILLRPGDSNAFPVEKLDLIKEKKFRNDLSAGSILSISDIHSGDPNE